MGFLIAGIIVLLAASVVHSYCGVGMKCSAVHRPMFFDKVHPSIPHLIWIFPFFIGISLLFISNWITGVIGLFVYWFVMPLIITPFIRKWMLPPWDELPDEAKASLQRMGYGKSNYLNGDWWKRDDYKPKRKRARMGQHKNVQIECTVADGLDIAPITALRIKMQQRLDRLIGTQLENTPYHEKEKETISRLKRAEEIDFNSIWRAIPKDYSVTEGELKAIVFKPTIVMSEDSEHTSLVYQRFNIFIIVTQALQAIRDYLKAKESQGVKRVSDIQEIIDDIESQLIVLK